MWVVCINQRITSQRLMSVTDLEGVCWIAPLSCTVCTITATVGQRLCRLLETMQLDSLVYFASEKGTNNGPT